MASTRARRDWLSRNLRELREATGLSGVRAARELGIPQSKISRLERGEFLPDASLLEDMARLYGIPAPLRRELVQAAEDLRTRTRPTRAIISRGENWKMQRTIRRIENNAGEICGYQNAVVIGLLQTPAYMRLIFAEGGEIRPADVEKSIEERIARTAVLTSDRALSLIMSEGALRWQAGSPQVMTEQLEHLITTSLERPHIKIGVIPQSQASVTFPMHGFSMYDRRTVIVGVRSGTQFISDAGDVDDYSQLFDQLEAMARTGDEGREIIRRIADEYRRMS